MSKHVYIIHGYRASPAHHWFPWLADQLAKGDSEVSILAMPNSSAPEPTAWVDFLDTSIAALDPHTFFVAHSLGCITLLRYLQLRGVGRTIGGMVLVSGFAQPLPVLPELNPFIDLAFDPAEIMQSVPQRIAIASRDDSLVPFAHTERLSQQLDAQLYSVEHGGHFLAADGFTEFPLVRDCVEAMLGK